MNWPGRKSKKPVVHTTAGLLGDLHTKAHRDSRIDTELIEQLVNGHLASAAYALSGADWQRVPEWADAYVNQARAHMELAAALGEMADRFGYMGKKPAGRGSRQARGPVDGPTTDQGRS